MIVLTDDDPVNSYLVIKLLLIISNLKSILHQYVCVIISNLTSILHQYVCVTV